MADAVGELEAAVAEFNHIKDSLPEANREAATTALNEAVVLFRGGDDIGGIAKTVDAVSELSAILSETPVGMAFGFITKLVGALLGLFQHESYVPTLLQQIEHFIDNTSLTTENQSVVAVTSKWNLAEMDLTQACQRAATKRREHPDAEMPSFDEITSGVDWMGTEKSIVEAFETLQNARARNLEEWQPLLATTILLADRFWKAFHQIGGVVSDPESFVKRRDAMATSFLKYFERNDDRLGLWDGIQQNCAAYYLGWDHRIWTRITVAAHGADPWRDVEQKKTSFAVSARGTVFCSGENSKLYLNRPTSDPGLPPNSVECDQVYIAERPYSSELLVGQVHDDGRSLTLRTFNDGYCKDEQEQSGFTHDLPARWGEYYVRSMPTTTYSPGHWYQAKIKTALILPASNGTFRVLVYLQHVEGDGHLPHDLYEGIFDPKNPGDRGKHEANLTLALVDGYRTRADSVVIPDRDQRARNGNLDHVETSGGLTLGGETGLEPRYTYVLPFTISMYNDRPAVHAGNQVTLWESGQIKTLDLNGLAHIDPAIWIHRAEFLDDETVALMTSKGLFVRHVDVSTNGERNYPWWNDDEVGGEWFAKRTSPIFPIFKSFYESLRRFAPPR